MLREVAAHSTAQLRELGDIVDHVLCVVDRGEGVPRPAPRSVSR